MKILREFLKTKQAKNTLIIMFFCFFFLIRLYRLGYHDFWYDEIATINYARCPWWTWNAPLYWVLLHFWIKIFGISEISLRFPSLVFNFSSTILIFLLGARLFSKRTGLLAALLMGLSPFHLWYAQEARDYSMVLFFGTLSSLLLVEAFKESKIRLWLFYVAASLLGLYTNYFYIFLFIAQAVWLAFFKRKQINGKIILSMLAVCISFSLYLPRFFRKFFYINQGFWIPRPQWESLLITFENFMLGYNGTSFLYLFSNILVVASFVLAIIGLQKSKTLKDSFMFCSILLFVPVFAAFIFSRVSFSVYLDRGFLMFSPYLYLVTAFGISSLRKVPRILLLCILVSVLTVSGCRYFNDQIFEQDNHHIGTYIKKPIRPIVEFIRSHVSEYDIIAVTNPSVIVPAYYYGLNKSYTSYYFFDPDIIETSWQRPHHESRYYIPLHKINNLEFENLWVLSSDWGRSGELDENSQSAKAWLDDHFQQESKAEINGLWILKYVRNES